MNPFRGIQGLTAERVDQGVDFAGAGPIYALGNGVVLNTVSGGWPGGAYISYRLTDGPAVGLVVYSAENIIPGVQIGQTVNVNTVIGTLVDASPNSESGWGDLSGAPQALASGQFDGSSPTALGVNFNQLLIQLGAMPGLVNGSATGALPPGWTG